jgi:hypothetical protein
MIPFYKWVSIMHFPDSYYEEFRQAFDMYWHNKLSVRVVEELISKEITRRAPPKDS